MNGCNSHTGTYQISANCRITFSVFASTRRFCPNDFDYIYLNSVKSSVSFNISSGTITFRNQQGSISIVLKPYINNPTSQRLSF